MNKKDELTFGDVEEILIRETNLASQRIEAIAPIEDYRFLREPNISSMTVGLRKFPARMGRAIPFEARTTPFEENCQISNNGQRFLDYLPAEINRFSAGKLYSSKFCWGLSTKELVRRLGIHLQEPGEKYTLKLYGLQGREITSTKDDFLENFEIGGFAIGTKRIMDPFYGSDSTHHVGDVPRLYGAIFEFKEKEGFVTFSEDRYDCVRVLEKFKKDAASRNDAIINS